MGTFHTGTWFGQIHYNTIVFWHVVFLPYPIDDQHKPYFDEIQRREAVSVLRIRNQTRLIPYDAPQKVRLHEKPDSLIARPDGLEI